VARRSLFAVTTCFLVGGEEELVRGDDVLLGLDGLADRGARRLLAADQLDEDLDLGIVDDLGGARGEELRVDLDQAPLLRLAHGDLLHDHAGAEALFDRGGVVPEELQHPRADVSEAEEADAELSHGRTVAPSASPCQTGDFLLTDGSGRYSAANSQGRT
jgi:hypothetical protein